MRADEDAKGLHTVSPKEPHEQTALIIFCLTQKLTPDFAMTSDDAVGVIKGSYGTDDSVWSALKAFEETLNWSDHSQPKTGVLAAKFLAFVAANPEDDEPKNIEWSICKKFNSAGANPFDTTYWMEFDPNGKRPPRYTSQDG